MWKEFISRKWRLLLGGAIALWLIHSFFSPMAQPEVDPLDSRIRDLRTGALVIQVVDARQQPVAGAKVDLEQTSHAFEFGTALSSEMFSDGANATEKSQYLTLVKQLFNAGVHENALKWYSTEPAQGQVDYSDADRILAWAEQNQLKMRGHNLFWAPEVWNQPWIRALPSDALRQAVQHRDVEICSRYRDRIPEYDVLNEILNGDFFQRRLGESIVDDMFRWCHEADPSAQLYTNEYNILNGEQLDAYVKLIRSLLDRGVPLSGIGVQAHLQQDISPEQIQHSLDTLASFGLPIKITEFSALTDADQKQAQMLTNLYRVAFAHPAVTGIFMWGFWEGAHWLPDAAIFKRNFEPKLAAQAYKDLVFQQWWTRASGVSDRTGEFSTRAFWGTYSLTVDVGGHLTTKTFTLSPDQATRQVITIS